MASFTPQQIEQFLQEFFDVVGARQYVGARYVPIFGRPGEGTVEWDDGAPYEPLTVVMHDGVSYVSRRYVPTGIQIADTAYWVQTYRFNAQVEQYRQEVLEFQAQIDGIRTDMESDYLPFPIESQYPKYGTLGQVLTTLANGETKWEDPVTPSDEQATAIIDEWLEDHPEATTTVTDGSITNQKIADSTIEDEKLVQNGGVLELTRNLSSLNPVLFESSVNLIKRPLLYANQYVGLNGEINDSASFYRTNFIPISPNETYIGYQVGLSAFYDESLTFISTVAHFNSAVTPPANARYARCSIATANINTAVLVTGNTVPSSPGNGYLTFDELYEASESKVDDIVLWFGCDVDADTYTITFPARTVFQSLRTGKWVLINAAAQKSYTLADGYKLYIDYDFMDNVTVTDFDGILKQTQSGTYVTNKVVLERISTVLLTDMAYVQTKLIPENLNYLSNLGVWMWTGVTVDVDTYTITFPARTVFENLYTGKYLLITADSSKSYTLADGYKLYIDFDFKTNATVNDFDDVLKTAALASSTTYKSVYARASYALYSDIPQVEYQILQHTNPSTDAMPQPKETSLRLSDAAPIYSAIALNRVQDVNVVIIGDSLSTALGYEATPRPDAMYRPPLMTEYTYPSYIEEQLRWDGQAYNRFDVDGVFTETCDSAATLTEDTLHWDWGSNNNRPAITRCLSGTNCSVSYIMDVNYKRVDYIYRTDDTNPATATVYVSGGNGVVLVYDETTTNWVEANNYSFSAQESSTPIISSYNSTPLMKSMYQKRLNMKWASAPAANTRITIANNGSGRLTYWGIQKGKREVMMNFINASRGGHSCERIKPFEEWDVDYWEPKLILWEPPYFNHLGVDIYDASYQPITNKQTVSAFVARFTDYITPLLSKQYSPEVVAWSMWVADNTVHCVNATGEWLFGVATDGSFVSTRTYVNGILSMLGGLDVPTIDFLGLLHDYGYDYQRFMHSDNYETVTTYASGIGGSSWTYDGAHLNDLGHRLMKQMFGSFFME